MKTMEERGTTEAGKKLTREIYCNTLLSSPRKMAKAMTVRFTPLFPSDPQCCLHQICPSPFIFQPSFESPFIYLQYTSQTKPHPLQI